MNTLKTGKRVIKCREYTETDYEEVYLKNTVQSVHDEAFKKCKNLKKVTIESLDILLPSVFEYCTSLEEVNLPDNLYQISDFAFGDCTSLKSIILPSGLVQIDTAAFVKSGLESIILPDSINFIDSSAFSFCRNLKEVILPRTLKFITEGMFYNCISLEKITLPEGLKAIDDFAFNCNSDHTMVLEDIYIPSSVEKISETAFTPDTTIHLSRKQLEENPGLNEFCKVEIITDIDELIKHSWERTGLSLKEINEKILEER